MNDGIPFKADPLRYGGDKRESGMQYWIDLLEEYKLPYYVVKATDRRLQTNEVCSAVIKFFDEKTKKYQRIQTLVDILTVWYYK